METDDVLLSDSQIQHSGLISHNFDTSCLGGCTYEFRVSTLAYRYDYEKRTSRQETADIHIIQPFETLTIITLEAVKMDHHHFLFLYAKGFLFSLGVVPVCTGADPGFEGRLGINLTNISARPIKLPAGTRFLKGIFHQIGKMAEMRYSGQHGDASMSWPYPSQFHVDSVDQDQYIQSMKRFLPSTITDTVGFSRSAAITLRRVFWMLIIVAILNICAYVMRNTTSTSWGQGLYNLFNLLGTIASVVSLLIVFLQERRVNKNISDK
jgi:deoxycytidine triphosphate deaminase